MLSETNQGKVCGAGWANNKLTHEGWLLSQRRRTVRLLWAERPASYWLESNTRSRRGANCRQPVKKHTNYLLAFRRPKVLNTVQQHKVTFSLSCVGLESKSVKWQRPKRYWRHHSGRDGMTIALSLKLEQIWFSSNIALVSYGTGCTGHSSQDDVHCKSTSRLWPL